MATVKDLKKLIKALPETMLEHLGVPNEDIAVFKNYKIFPTEILVKADWNYKKEDEFTSQQLRNNIKRIGQVENIQVRELETGYYEVVNGNHRLDEFIALDKTFIIAYDHGKISQAEAMRIATETNETRFEKDNEKLAKLMAELKNTYDVNDLLNTMPFSNEEFDDLIRISGIDFNSLPDDINEIEEDNFNEAPPEKPKTVRGDVYELNNHRLLCGDSTNENDVVRLLQGNLAHLIYTDPPYNIKYAEFNKTRGDTGKDWTDEYCSEWEDDMTDEDYIQFLNKFMALGKKYSIEWSHYYVWHATTYFFEVLNAFKVNEIPYDKVPIQWLKNVAPMSRVHYWRKTEPCVFGGKGAVNGQGKGARWFGPKVDYNVWEVKRDATQNYIHPTQKPIALAVRAITNSSQPGEIVWDMFLGSGTTLIASDMLQRKCFGMEYEPKFCDVIVKRYIKYCADNNKPCEVRHNGQLINLTFFGDNHEKEEREVEHR